MSHRQKNSHKSRHRRHAINPPKRPLLESGQAKLETTPLAPPPPLSADVGEADAEEDIVTQAEASRP